MLVVKKAKDRRPLPPGWANDPDSFQEYIGDLHPKEFAKAMRSKPHRFILHARHLMTHGHWNCLVRSHTHTVLKFGNEFLTAYQRHQCMLRDPALFASQFPHLITAMDIPHLKEREPLLLLQKASQFLSEEEFMEMVGKHQSHVLRFLEFDPKPIIPSFARLSPENQEKLHWETKEALLNAVAKAM